MTTKNCANGPKLVLKDLCEKSEKERRKKKNVANAMFSTVHFGIRFSSLILIREFNAFCCNAVPVTLPDLPLSSYSLSDELSPSMA